MVKEVFIRHHYEPENRVRESGVIIFRQSGDQFSPCYEEVKEIYGKVRRLLRISRTRPYRFCIPALPKHWLLYLMM